jgi:hypothetical protein
MFTIDESSAREVSHRFIKENAYHIQIGAFKSDNNVNSAIKKLNDFDVYVDPYKGLHRVIVVNILRKQELNRSFVKIKKFYPNAFLTKQPIKRTNQRKKVTKKSNSKKTINHYNQLFKSMPEKREIIKPRNDTLNSNTILKTRKSFL